MWGRVGLWTVERHKSSVGFTSMKAIGFMSLGNALYERTLHVYATGDRASHGTDGPRASDGRARRGRNPNAPTTRH
jgi:hypothetical protein